MRKFNNNTYKALVKDLLNDAFYINGRSARGKTATIRQYTEVIVRKILDYSNTEYVTLGNKKILEEIRIKSKDNRLLLESLKNICTIGNACTHTQKTDPVTDADVNFAIENLFNLYSYLLIDYFEKYEFGSNPQIMSSFSLLPPIIRYIVLDYLNKKYPKNIFIIDKLCLAILKAFDKEKAIKWIKERKGFLKNMPLIPEKEKEGIIEKHGRASAEVIISLAPNMYENCISKIKRVDAMIKDNGKLYDDFESAIEYYKKEGKVEGGTSEIIEFNSIMEFLYLGRKTRKNELLNKKNTYFVIDNIFN